MDLFSILILEYLRKEDESILFACLHVSLEHHFIWFIEQVLHKDNNNTTRIADTVQNWPYWLGDVWLARVL